MLGKNLLNKIIHDLATPLTANINFIELCNMDQKNQAQYLEKMAFNTNKLVDIINLWRKLIYLEDDESPIEIDYFRELIEFAEQQKRIIINIENSSTAELKIVYKILFVMLYIIKFDGYCECKISAEKLIFKFNVINNLSENFLLDDEIFRELIDVNNFVKKFSYEFNKYDNHFMVCLNKK